MKISLPQKEVIFQARMLHLGYGWASASRKASEAKKYGKQGSKSYKKDLVAEARNEASEDAR